MTRTSSATIARTTTDHGRRSATRTTIVRGAPVAAGVSAEASCSCPTCLAAGDLSIDTLPGAAHPGVLPAQCPTCGVASIEYGLILAIDSVLVEMHGIERLDAAI